MKLWIARIGGSSRIGWIAARYGVKTEPGKCLRRQGACDPLAPSRHAHDQGDHEQDEEKEEQDLRNPGRSGSDAAEAEYRGDHRYNEENKSPRQHVVLRN
jgi:hypothetical protein